MSERIPTVAHWDINANDPELLWSFYGDLFGWELKNAGFTHPYRYLDATDGGIGGGIGQAPRAGEPDAEDRHTGLTFYIRVTDLSAALERAIELGGTRMWGPTQPHEGLALAMFRDPEGNAVGLMSDALNVEESK